MSPSHGDLSCADPLNVSFDSLAEMHSLALSALIHDDLLAAFSLEDLSSARLPFSSDHEQQELLQSRPVAGSLALEARMERFAEGMGRLLSDTRAESRAGLR